MKENWFKRHVKCRDINRYYLEGESDKPVIISLPPYIENGDEIIVLSRKSYDALSKRAGDARKHKTDADDAEIIIYEKDSQLVDAIKAVIRRNAQLKVGQDVYFASPLDTVCPTDWDKTRIAAIRVEVVVGDCRRFGEGDWDVTYLDEYGREIDNSRFGCARQAFPSFKEMKADAVREYQRCLGLWQKLEEE